jgi:ribonuclease III
MESKDHSEIEQRINYQFKDKELLHEALRHSSFVNEMPDCGLQDNECLEFLGDAVLNLTIGHLLMVRHPDLKEGDLSRMRAYLVNESQLAEIARLLDLGSYIQLGRGEIQTGGCEKNSILADTFEAVMAAVYLDGGLAAAFHIIENNFMPLLNHLGMATNDHDHKSQLQEKIQEGHGEMPDYRIIRADGPDHDKTFWVQLTVGDVGTQGVGKSKKMAEQDAARKALEILKEKFKISTA